MSASITQLICKDNLQAITLLVDYGFTMHGSTTIVDMLVHQGRDPLKFAEAFVDVLEDSDVAR
jgi:hypothetical protein